MYHTSANAIEASKAVNSLMHLYSRDQESLLAVVEDYFTSPIDDPASDDSDTELDTDEPGILNTSVHMGIKRGTE